MEINPIRGEGAKMHKQRFISINQPQLDQDLPTGDQRWDPKMCLMGKVQNHVSIFRPRKEFWYQKKQHPMTTKGYHLLNWEGKTMLRNTKVILAKN